MPGREHRHALGERESRDEGDLSKAVAVLEQKRLAVELDALPSISRCCGHAVSMRKRPIDRPYVFSASGNPGSYGDWGRPGSYGVSGNPGS